MATITLKSAATGYNPAPSDNGNGGDGYHRNGQGQRIWFSKPSLMTVILTVVRNAAPAHGDDALPPLIIGTQSTKKSLMGTAWPDPVA